MPNYRQRLRKLEGQRQAMAFTLPAGVRISDADLDAEGFAVVVETGTEREIMSGEEYRTRYPQGLLIEYRTHYRLGTPRGEKVQPLYAPTRPDQQRGEG